MGLCIRKLGNLSLHRAPQTLRSDKTEEIERVGYQESGIASRISRNGNPHQVMPMQPTQLSNGRDKSATLDTDILHEAKEEDRFLAVECSAAVCFLNCLSMNPPIFCIGMVDRRPWNLRIFMPPIPQCIGTGKASWLAINPLYTRRCPVGITYFDCISISVL